MALNKLFFPAFFFLLTTFQANAQKETRELAPFHKISIALAANVYLEPAQHQSLEIEAEEELMEHLITEVKNGELQIKLEKAWQNKRWKSTPTIYISLPELEALKVAGSASVQTEKTFRSKQLELAVSGSGSIRMPLEADDLDLKVTGSGDMDLQGQAENARIRISGSGEVNASSLRVQSCEIRISGSGDCRIRAEEALTARISGSGRVLYSGTPQQLNVQTSGSGAVVKAGE